MSGVNAQPYIVNAEKRENLLAVFFRRASSTVPSWLANQLLRGAATVNEYNNDRISTWNWHLPNIIAYSNDEAVRQKAYEIYSDRIKDLKITQYEVDEYCKAWYNSRNPLLAELLLQQNWVSQYDKKIRIYTILQTGKLELLSKPGTRQTRTIIEALQDKDKTIAQNALVCLKNLTTASSLNVLAQEWAESRSEMFFDLLLEKNHVAPYPLEAYKALYIHVQLKGDLWLLLDDTSVENLFYLVKATGYKHPLIALRAAKILAKLRDTETQQELCRLIIQEDLPKVEEIALKAGYLPTENYDKALFYFVTEQWDKYDTLDFDQRYLRTAYSVADEKLRRRLSDKIRQSGRSEYLTVLAGNDFRTRTAEISMAEAEVLVQILANSREWAKLWGLVFELPLQWSVKAVESLAQAGWLPQNEDEQAIFRQLAALCQNLVSDEQAALKELPPAVIRAKVKVPGRVNALAFANSSPLLAIGTGTGKVVIWNMQTACREAIVRGFTRSVGLVEFTPTNVLLCAERTSTDDGTCGVYAWQSGTLAKLAEHTGSVTAMAVVDADSFISAGRHHRFYLYKFSDPNNPLQRTYLWRNWIRYLLVSPDKSKLMAMQDYMTFYTLPDLHHLQAISSKVVRCATFSPDGTSLLTGNLQGEIKAYFHEPQNQSFIAEQQPLRNADGVAVQSLVTLPNLPVIVYGTANGQIFFKDWATRTDFAHLLTEGERLTSLKISPDGNFMAVGDSDASFSLWDLRTLELRRLFSQPLAQAKAVHMAALAVLKQSDLAFSAAFQNTLYYLETLLRHRFRFDVELDEPNIQIGEFDIEIE
jgi:WD40 repeat protein